MRKLPAAIAVLIAFAPALISAQETGLSSLQFDSSFGVFSNELDGALSVDESASGPGFSQLTSSYFFGGVGNLNKTPDVSAGALAVPMWLGYFNAGPMPWSVFAGFFDTTGPTSTAANGITNATTTTAPIANSTGGTVTYTYTTSSTDVVQNVPFYKTLNQQGQFLTRFDGINLGLWAQVNLVNNSLPANNYTQTATDYYVSTAATATAAPKTSPNGTVVTTGTNANVAAGGISNTYAFEAPVFFKTGSISHFAQLGATINTTDNSTNTTSTTTPATGDATAPAVAPFAAYTDTLANGISQHTAQTNIDAAYTAQLPAFFVHSQADSFFAGVTGNIGFNSRDYIQTITNQNYTWAGGKAVPVKGALTSTTDTRTFTGATTYTAQVTTGQSFYFDLGDSTRFGLIPQLSLGFSHNQTDPDSLTQDVSVAQSSATGDPKFSSTGDTTATTTLAYTNATASGNLVTSNAFTTTLSVPIALKIQPKGWLFGLTVGSEPQLSLTATTTSTATSVSSRTVSNATVGAATTTSTVSSADSATTSRSNTAWSVTVPHSIGAEFDLSEMVKLFVDVSAAVSGGIWDFRNLVIQGVVALK